MYFRRVVRTVAVAVCAVGLLAAPAPPAHAVSVGHMVFQGYMNFSTGAWDYSCPWTKNKCAFPDMTPGGVDKKSLLLQVNNGNIATGTFSSAVCFGAEVTATKGKVPVSAPSCTIGAFITARGFCDLSSGGGSGAGNFEPTISTPNWFFFNYTYTQIGGWLILRGNWWKGGPTKPATSEGDLYVQIATATTYGSCLNKTATGFSLIGFAELVHPKVTL